MNSVTNAQKTFILWLDWTDTHNVWYIFLCFKCKSLRMNKMYFCLCSKPCWYIFSFYFFYKTLFYSVHGVDRSWGMISCSLFLHIHLCSSLNVWPLPYIPCIIQTKHWVLNKYLFPKSYTTGMQYLTVSKGRQVILSIITSPLWKKANFWSLLYGWRSRDLAEGKRGNTVEARIAKKEQEIFVLYYEALL